MDHRCVIASALSIFVVFFVWLPIVVHHHLSWIPPRKVCGSTIENVTNVTQDNTTTSEKIVCSKFGVNLYHCGDQVYWTINPNNPTDHISNAPEALHCQVKEKEVLQCDHHLLYQIGNVAPTNASQ
jgi:hypothetical protein